MSTALLPLVERNNNSVQLNIMQLSTSVAMVTMAVQAETRDNVEHCEFL